MLSFDPSGPVVLVGGYGVVGSETARLLRQHHPDLPVVLAGRSPERGVALARELDLATLVWDLGAPEAPDIGASAVVTLVNDPNDHALRACLAGGVPYADIARWTARIQRAASIVAVAAPRAPVILSSGWMGGIAPRVVGALASSGTRVTHVDASIRYDLSDKAGVDSVEFLDRLDRPFEVMSEGRERLVGPLTQRRRVLIGPHRVQVARFDTPEQFTLPITLGVRDAATRIGFSSNVANWSLLALRRLGFFRLARGDRWSSARRALLYQPGDGGIARILLRLRGPQGEIKATVTDSRGQAHLTAVGAMLSLREALNPDTPVGLSYPETLAGLKSISDIRAAGVAIEFAGSTVLDRGAGTPNLAAADAT